MKKTRGIEKEAEQFFQEMGLEEEIAKMSELFTENFMIQGEETEELREALHRAPDSLLDMIWEKIGPEGDAAAVDREQKEEQLYEDIPGYLASRMEVMDIEKLKLLLRVMGNNSLSYEELVVVYEELVSCGWAFAFYEDGQCFFVVMKEVRDILKTIEDPEMVKRIAFSAVVRSIVSACVDLYGVCSLEQMGRVLVEASDHEKDQGYMEQLLNDLLPYFEEQNLLWQDGEYVISPHLDKAEYKNLLRSRRGSYAMPENDWLENYARGRKLEKNTEYEAVHQLLSRETKDQEETEEMLEEIAGYVTREDWEIPQIMNCLYDWDVAFENSKSAEKLVEALSQWTYGIHRWSECGYSRKALGKENRDLKYIRDKKDKAGEGAVKKIYPNAPCPCGSGKKYKKCCGRK